MKIIETYIIYILDEKQFVKLHLTKSQLLEKKWFVESDKEGIYEVSKDWIETKTDFFVWNSVSL